MPSTLGFDYWSDGEPFIVRGDSSVTYWLDGMPFLSPVELAPSTGASSFTFSAAGISIAGGYTRMPVVRSGIGWVVAGNSASLATPSWFPLMNSGAGGWVTHFGVGTSLTGTGQLLFFGAASPSFLVTTGVVPKLDESTVVSNDSPDSLADAAATALMSLLFKNTDWSNVGDAAGLQNSAVPGNLYLSLHTASPGEGGNQTTNEIAYS